MSKRRNRNMSRSRRRSRNEGRSRRTIHNWCPSPCLPDAAMSRPLSPHLSNAPPPAGAVLAGSFFPSLPLPLSRLSRLLLLLSLAILAVTALTGHSETLEPCPTHPPPPAAPDRLSQLAR